MPASMLARCVVSVSSENERQRARRHRKLAAVRARGLQPPPSLLGEPSEPAIRWVASFREHNEWDCGCYAGEGASVRLLPPLLMNEVPALA